MQYPNADDLIVMAQAGARQHDYTIVSKHNLYLNEVRRECCFIGACGLSKGDISGERLTWQQAVGVEDSAQGLDFTSGINAGFEGWPIRDDKGEAWFAGYRVGQKARGQLIG